MLRVAIASPKGHCWPFNAGKEPEGMQYKRSNRLAAVCPQIRLSREG